jgi:hypothetical protein
MRYPLPFNANRSAVGTTRLRKPCEWLERLLIFYATALVAVGCVSAAGKDSASPPAFDGVTTQFTLTRARIKSGQELEVRAVIRNTSDEPRVFRFVDFGVDARVYSGSKLLGDLCPTTDDPVQVIRLKPGERCEMTRKVFTTLCYKLAPGRYSIRFNYNLRAFASESLRNEYQGKYNPELHGIVPWDACNHPFTVVR